MARVILNIKVHIRKEGALIHSLLPKTQHQLGTHLQSSLPPSLPLFFPLPFFFLFILPPYNKKAGCRGRVRVDLKNLIIPSPSTYSET